MRADTEWFEDAGWGIFIHFLAAPASSAGGAEVTAEIWNQRVNNFDVGQFAEQLELVGAKYCFVSIGQNSGHYCSPNATYDSLVGIKPSKCSTRDLISDLYDELNHHGIKLMVYLPVGAPSADPVAVKKLGWEWGFKGGHGTETQAIERTGKRLAEFQIKWEAIIREWSLRWGKGVNGWWMDGCYFADEMYRYPDSPNFQSFASALKAGNSDAIVAFNPGVRNPIISLTEFEDYTAGEISNTLPTNGVEPCVIPLNRWVNGAQYHILTFLGGCWGKGTPRFSDDFPLVYTRYVNSWGGVITWDVPITKEGLIPDVFIKQLIVLRNGNSKK